MYNINNVNISSKDMLNKYVSDEQILSFYFGDYELNRMYTSPFREENNPSFIISYFQDMLMWRDFGISNKPDSVISLVSRLKNLDYFGTLNIIHAEMVLDKKIVNIPTPKKPKYDTDNRSAIISKLKDYQLEYWNKGRISLDTLLKFKVSWCKELWFGDKMWTKGSKHNLCYFYDHNEDIFDTSWTVYRPNAVFEKKFRKFNIDGRIMGLQYIPDNGELLLITKSYKDIMLLHEIGVPAIAPHNENIPISEEVINSLKLRFNKIYVNYDNDNTGVNSSIAFTKKYDLNYWNLPKDLNCKDPFDCATIYGLDRVFDNLNEKLKRDGNIGI